MENMRLLDLVIVASMAGSAAACGLQEVGIPAEQADAGDGGGEMDVRAADAPGHDVVVVDARGMDSRADSPHEADANGKDSGGKGPCPTTPDCSNPACKSEGYVCTPPAPKGWDIAAVDFTTEVACPPGYAPSYTVFTAPTGSPAVCDCSCSLGSSPSCTTGDFEFAYGATDCSNTDVATANDGMCLSVSVTFVGDIQIVTTPPATGGTCDKTQSVSVPPYVSTSNYVCALNGTASTAGCMGGEVCVATTSAQTRCIVQDGSASCPAPYTVAHPVGISVLDTRGCTGACTCGAPSAACDEQTWNFYTADDCTGTPVPAPMDGTCDPVGSLAGTYLSNQYTADPTGVTCGLPLASPSPSGSVSLDTPQTVCCLP
jgi:hypothetical protein